MEAFDLKPEAAVERSHPAGHERLGNLGWRIVSNTLIWPLLIWSIFTENRPWGDAILLCATSAMALLGLRELFGMMDRAGIAHSKWLGYTAGALLSTLTYLLTCPLLEPWNAAPWADQIDLLTLSGAVLVAMGFAVFCGDVKDGFERVATTITAILYIPWMVSFMIKIFFTSGPAGAVYLFFFIVVTKMGDVGAYLIGGLFGRTRMMPKISPGKTWEGFAGAILASLATAMLIIHFLGARMPEMGLPHAVILGMVLGVTGALGDLFASLFKREAGVKDSGKIVPGIGGMLDLIDSPLFNAPIMYFYIQLFLTPTP